MNFCCGRFHTIPRILPQFGGISKMLELGDMGKYQLAQLKQSTALSIKTESKPSL